MDAKLQELCRQAHEDRIRVGMLDTDTKNRTLELAADALMAHEQEILEANAIDMERGRERNMPQGLLDRLKLDHDRLLGMADGLRQVAKLEDPIGEVMSMRKRPNGLPQKAPAAPSPRLLRHAHSHDLNPAQKPPHRSVDSYRLR